jgi:GNAT superfamily N-acetyltransferase
MIRLSSPVQESRAGERFPILRIMLTTRLAAISDAALITAHREAMFAEMGKSTEPVLAEMSRNFEPWVKRMMEAGRYIGWVIEDRSRPIASAGFFALEWPPHPLDPSSSLRGYLLNFWVEPKYRGRGLAHSLVKECLAESRKRRLLVVSLHASDAGRPVYESMGFHPSNEMFYVEPAKVKAT